MTNTPIKQLVAEYAAEECNFDDTNWVVGVSEMYVNTMPDSQVRCLLHALINEVKKNEA